MSVTVKHKTKGSLASNRSLSKLSGGTRRIAAPDSELTVAISVEEKKTRDFSKSEGRRREHSPACCLYDSGGGNPEPRLLEEENRNPRGGSH